MGLSSPLDALEQILSTQTFDDGCVDCTELEKRIAFLERLAEVENSSVAVLDLCQKKYVFLRSKFAVTADYNLNDVFAMGPAYYFSLIHPDDIPVILDTYKKSFAYILSLPIEERKDYKAILNFRIRNNKNTYIGVILQLVILELDQKGNIWLVLILDDILPDKVKFNKVNRRLVNIKTGKFCLFRNETQNNIKSTLSSRELDILGLASKGFVSKEIADKLFVSVNTVNNHRQKILEKINATNITEAVTFAKNLGLL